MFTNKVFRTIDTHTGGNPTRTVISGLPKFKGQTMSEKMLDMKKNHDWIRRFLMYEPRGHEVMSGALVTEPCDSRADFGIIYIETGGYLPMCGHDTIGVCTALIESGIVENQEPMTKIVLDTPAGIVTVMVEIEAGKAKNVTYQNVPSFLLKSIEIEIKNLPNCLNSLSLHPKKKTISCNIAYGGNFYGIIEADELGLDIVPENASIIIEAAVEIRNYINSVTDVVHPEHVFISGLTHIEFSTAPTNPTADIKNTVVVPPGGIDRSPCGTGTSAKLACLFAKNKIQLNDTFTHESILGSIFQGSILEITKVGNVEGVITEISGSAWIMGMHTFTSSTEDELNEGFLLINDMPSH